jgi:signal transduction histidine kinase
VSRTLVAETIRVLSIDAETSRPNRLERLLASSRRAAAAGSDRFNVAVADCLSGALELLGKRRTFDVVVLDLDCTGNTGLAAIVRLQAAAPKTPVIIVAGVDDLRQAAAAIRQGAQDWLVKGELTGPLLARTIRHAMTRKHREIELRRQVRRLDRARAKTEHQVVELGKRAEELDAINRELDDFVYVASHDLKEPLRGIKVYCELLAEECKNRLRAAGADRLRAIMAMCGRLETQISDLLTYYRVGRIRPPGTLVDLAEIVEGQVAAFRAMLDRRNAVVQTKGPLPRVQGHPVLLGMVVGNLISNGLKYNRSERPLVEIGAVAEQPGTVYVRDNGIGIAREYHEEIFALFRRLHGPKEFEGSGAGLTIVRKIIHSHGGRIWLESEPGRGSTFYFSLPPASGETTRPPHWLAMESADTDATDARDLLPG